MKKILRNGCLLAIALFCIVYPIYILIVQPGFFQWNLSLNENHKMMIELLIWFIIALAGIKWHNVNWILVISIVFSYLHMMFLPMLLAVVYAVLTYFVGSFANCYVLRQKENGSFFISYFFGMMLLTICYALLSAAKIGSIRNIQIFDGGLLILLAVWYVKRQKGLINDFKAQSNVSKNAYVKLCVVMCFVMLAIGRANISLDVDSVWYGLRSAFVLDNQTGIYDNLKMVGCVYTYPKGYETYVLPLSGFTSYGFIYAGNIIFALLILYIAYKICRLFLNREKALWGMVFVSAIPGIMNMSITAKSDIITLFAQLLGIYFALLFVKEKKGIYLGMVAATYIYAQSLKTTAVVFSTTILMVVIFISVVYRIKPRFGKASVILTVISLIDLAFIWFRTYLFTGIPATSVWGKIFRAMGMTDKYPYASGQISQFRSEGLFSEEVISATITRMKEFFFAPNSQDTDHIILAWGTTLCTFLFLVIILGGLFDIKNVIKKIKSSALGCFMGLLVVGEFCGCLLSLWLLSKPDGNYFMLYYSVSVIGAVIYVQCELVEHHIYHAKIVTAVFLLFLPLNVVFTGATTWAWTSCFNEINWVNRGYYNHLGQFKKEMYDMGCKKIYNIMSAVSTNKVFAFGPHPYIEQIPCVVESEQDVSFWGNAELTSTPENFMKFVEYEQYDYIYLSPGYVTKESGAYANICALFETNKISDIRIEKGNILLTVGENSDSIANLNMKSKFIKQIAKQK